MIDLEDALASVGMQIAAAVALDDDARTRSIADACGEMTEFLLAFLKELSEDTDTRTDDRIVQFAMLVDVPGMVSDYAYKRLGGNA